MDAAVTWTAGAAAAVTLVISFAAAWLVDLLMRSAERRLAAREGVKPLRDALVDHEMAVPDVGFQRLHTGHPISFRLVLLVRTCQLLRTGPPWPAE